MIRILGIDPGSLTTGFGVIELGGLKTNHVASGCIQTSGEDFPLRLRDIFEGMSAVVRDYGPAEVVVERAFVHRNADSALKLGQARAAAICGTMLQTLPVFEYAPREIKLAVVGRGGATKEQVQHMVKVLLGLRESLQADAADALAVALCHAHGRLTRARLREATGRERPGL